MFTTRVAWGSTNGAWYGCPRIIVLTTRMQRWNSPIVVFTVRSCKTSVPKMYSDMGDTYTWYVRGGNLLIPSVTRGPASRKWFDPNSLLWLHWVQKTCPDSRRAECCQHPRPRGLSTLCTLWGDQCIVSSTCGLWSAGSPANPVPRPNP